MDEQMITAVKNWLDAVMPAVVEALVNLLPEDHLLAMGNEEGIHGPYFVELEEFNAPITAINFFVIVVNDLMMMATTADFREARTDTPPELRFDSVFRVAEFPVSISSEEHISQLVNRVLDLYKESLN